jgi:hypothetical protein
MLPEPLYLTTELTLNSSFIRSLFDQKLPHNSLWSVDREWTYQELVEKYGCYYFTNDYVMNVIFSEMDATYPDICSTNISFSRPAFVIADWLFMRWEMQWIPE